MAKSKDVMVARRSGRPAGVLVAFLSAVGIVYDEKHWHVVHHIFGRVSWIFALLLIFGLGWLVTRLCRRDAGRVQISSKKEDE